MPIKFQCTQCQSSIKAPDTHAGKKLPCPKCGQALSVPTTKSTQASTPATSSSTAPQEQPPTDPALPDVAAPEPQEDAIPEIVVRQPRQSSAPPPAPLAEASAAPNAFAPPQTRSERVADADLSHIRIVDLRLPFSSVFRFAVQFFLCNLLLGLVLGIVMFILSLLLAAIGIQFVPAAMTAPCVELFASATNAELFPLA